MQILKSLTIYSDDIPSWNMISASCLNSARRVGAQMSTQLFNRHGFALIDAFIDSAKTTFAY